MPKADANWALPTAVSIVREGNTNLDEYMRLPETRQFFPEMTLKVGEHSYDYFPVGGAFLALPQVFLLLQINGTKEVIRHSSEASKLVASSWMAISALLIFFGFRRKFGDSAAILAALLFSFATPALSSGSRAMWQQSASLLLNCVFIFFLTKNTFKKYELILLGFLLGFSVWVRPSTVVVSGPIFLYLIFLLRKGIVWVILPAMLSLGLYILYNLTLFGTFTPSYFNSHIGKIFQFSGFGEGLAGILFSPGRGIFVWSPFFLFGILGILRIRQDREKNLSILFLSCIITHIFVIASFHTWWGGHSIGPRLLAELSPFFLWFSIQGFLSLSDRGWKDRLLRNAWVIACIFSAIIHIRASVDPGPMYWNQVGNEKERSWDWKDPQFMSGDWSIKLLY
ncbi:glycosyltransferase family 39 protein [Leptospira wolffii]|uniref:Glycosyltransferase family 39 protein n=1 Tax=Leptospira wolffii TaxID=409998 RepID=A0ABV5BJ44_9LEPT|nr:glycosyltransferase family 39 protein [Leptospira wolffii]TGL49048.1 dolichyl-phosphate-mannose--protein mannosyltransferase [Leptospira wolffii]